MKTIKANRLTILAILTILVLISFLTYQTSIAQDSVAYLGEGKGEYNKPLGYDVLIVKKFYPFRAVVVAGDTYTSTFNGVNHGNKMHYERVWACRGAFCSFPTTLFMSDLVLAVGSSASTFILDDDTLASGDTRRPRILNSKGDVVDVIESTGLSYYYQFTSTISDTYVLDSEDSIIVFRWNVTTPKPTVVTETPTTTGTPVQTATATNTSTPPTAVVSPTVTTSTPTATTTFTSVPSDTPTSTATTTPTATPTPTTTSTPVEIVEAPKSFYHTLRVECDGSGVVSINGRELALVTVYVDGKLQHSREVMIPATVNVSNLRQGSVVEVVVDDSQGTGYIRSTTVDMLALGCELPDVALRKTLYEGQRDVVAKGAAVTFLIEVENVGNVALVDVKVVDYIPSGFALVEDDVWTKEGGNAVTTISHLWVGQIVRVPITLAVLDSVVDNVRVLNVAEATISGKDVNTANNTDDAEITVSAPNNLDPVGEPLLLFLPSLRNK